MTSAKRRSVDVVVHDAPPDAPGRLIGTTDALPAPSDDDEAPLGDGRSLLGGRSLSLRLRQHVGSDWETDDHG